jgi:predicted XRE-type DNA-binding protein
MGATRAEEYLKRLPGSESYVIPLRNLGRRINKTQKEKKDVTTVVTGDKGDGKTTLAWFASAFVDPDFDLERNFIFNPHFKIVSEKMWGMHDSAVVLDEGMKALYRQNWFKETQKTLYQMLNTTRITHNALFVCIPDWHDLRGGFMKTLVNYWIHIPTRGLGIVMQKSPNEFEADRWNIKENLKIFRDNTKGMSYANLSDDTNKLVSIHKKMPNYIGYVLFPKMPPEEEVRYKAISDPSKKAMWDLNEELAPESERQRKLRASLMRAIYLLNTRTARLTQADIVRELGVNDASVSQWLKIIRDEVEKKKQEVPAGVDVNESAENIMPDKREGAVG